MAMMVLLYTTMCCVLLYTNYHNYLPIVLETM